MGMRTHAKRKSAPCGLDNFRASTRTVQFDAPATATELRCRMQDLLKFRGELHITILGYCAGISSLNGVTIQSEQEVIVIETGYLQPRDSSIVGPLIGGFISR